MSSSVDFWYLRISINALVPGRYRRFPAVSREFVPRVCRKTELLLLWLAPSAHRHHRQLLLRLVFPHQSVPQGHPLQIALLSTAHALGSASTGSANTGRRPGELRGPALLLLDLVFLIGICVESVVKVVLLLQRTASAFIFLARARLRGRADCAVLTARPERASWQTSASPAENVKRTEGFALRRAIRLCTACCCPGSSPRWALLSANGVLDGEKQDLIDRLICSF